MRAAKSYSHSVYPALKLVDARMRRDAAHKKLLDGVDPSAARKSEKLAVRQSTETTFAAVARA